MRRSPSLSNLLALVSVAGLAVACNGEQAGRARDASALSSTGGSGPGGAGAPGTGGVAETGGNSGGVAGASSGSGGAAGIGGQAGATAGAGGGAAGGMGGAAGSRMTGTKQNGTTCGGGSECVSGYCFDGVCCSSDCSGKCRSCNNATGTCTPVPDGMDPKNQCDQQNPESCGTTGVCNGLGACKMFDTSTVCDQTPACDVGMSKVIQNKTCDGVGHCVDGKAVSCKGFRCVAATCGSICGSDDACVPGGFCSASTCVAASNIVGNGDLETGTLTGWQAANGLTTISLSSAAAGGPVHDGNYSVYGTNRGMTFHGPGYALPTGPGKYTISAWGMQKDDDLATVAFQIRLDCPDNASIPGSYVAVAFGIPLMKGLWTQFSATVDTSDLGSVTPGCLPATPGYVKSAVLYLNQINTDMPTGDVMFPDLYLDDVVVTVPDAHNLIGNPNFEAGVTSGWAATAGSLKISKTSASGFAHTGAMSLSLPTRATSGAGIKYALPTGAARYDVSFWAMQNGTTQPHQLQIQPSYTCIPPTGQSAVTVNPPPSTPVDAPAGTWVQVGGRFVFPPLDAPVGCNLQQASVTLQQVEQGACTTVECPDLFVDDASIIIPLQ